MDIHPNIIITIITTIGGIILAIVTAWSKSYFENLAKTKKLENIASKETITQMVKLQNWLDDIRQKYDFDRICICQFHNGGDFQTGMSMSKFSMTYESVGPGISSIKDNFKNIFISEYTKWMNALLNKDYIIKNYDELNDQISVDQFKKYGIDTSLSIPIKDINGRLTAFMWIHLVRSNEKFSQTEIKELVNLSYSIKGYLDMNKV
jgi:hypothetical protein